MTIISSANFGGLLISGNAATTLESWREAILRLDAECWVSRITYRRAPKTTLLSDLVLTYYPQWRLFYVSHHRYEENCGRAWAYTDITKIEPWIELVDDYWVSPAFFVSPEEAWRAVEDFFTMDGARSARVKWWDKPLPDGAMA